MGRSSKQGSNNSKGGGREIEIDKVAKLNKQEPHLSGAYIRSLVKQLTSSRTKQPMNHLKDPEKGDTDGFSRNKSLTKNGEGFSDQTHDEQSSQPNQQPQQHKKQVRRRLHTSRPYQERLLNMAEARREIVTALKFHRASMRQSNEPPPPPPPPPPPKMQPPSLVQDGNLMNKCRKNNPRIYIDKFSYSYSGFSCPPPNNSYSWPPPPIQENFNLTLPNQTLGLNLNFHDFNNLNTPFYHNPSIYSSSSSSSSTISVAKTEEVPYVGTSQDQEVVVPLVSNVSETSSTVISGIVDGGDLGLHQAMDDVEMAEIRSIGEQHQTEWNDRLNLVTSAWWFKFLKTMEIGPDEKLDEDDHGYHLFDEVMEEFPDWLNPNESCLQQYYFSDHNYDDYLQEHPALPSMDIEEIEGMDGDWLA